MVTLITEQLRKQSLEEHPHCRASSVNVSMPEVGCGPAVCWSRYESTPESSWSEFPSSKTDLQEAPLFLDTLGTHFPIPSSSLNDLSLQSSPPPPPPKRHCRSLSVPEDLSSCRTPWRPSASKVWNPVKRRCHSGGGVSCVAVGTLGGPVPVRRLSSSLTSSLHSSSSPTFFSLALSHDSPLPWSFPWDHSDPHSVCCSGFFPTPSSCSSSPAPFGSSQPLEQCHFSLSPVHMLPPQTSPSPAPRYPGTPAPSQSLSSACSTPAPSPSPSSACSTPSSSRRVLPPCLPRCHSQPCDMRKPRLKRCHDPDTLPHFARPGLDFSKMTQIGSGGPLIYGTAGCLEPGPGDFTGTFPSRDLLGRTSIGPLSESEEEEEKTMCLLEAGQQRVFERVCPELDLNLIEEN
ncbi:hypothetical protein UPYG_G00214160 [Umbra pygmaea]|uniref:Family with sequence similarity 53 member C n=1 Tax=Umbra pygmaea TaxID=75934 RepID=A0ABD0WKE9_UMBPY